MCLRVKLYFSLIINTPKKKRKNERNIISQKLKNVSFYSFTGRKLVWKLYIRGEFRIFVSCFSLTGDEL